MDTARPGYAYAPEAPAIWHVSYGPKAQQAKPLGVLGAATATLLAVNAVVGLVSSSIAGWSVLTYAGTSGLTVGSWPSQGTGVTRLALANAALAVATGVCFSGWLFRATTNLGLYGVRPRRGCGWAVGAWFVPVLNLWWPKQMVDDVVCGSRPDVPAGVDIRALRRSGLVTAWWVVWLLGGACAGAGVGVVAYEAVRLRTLLTPDELATRLSTLDVAQLLETQATWTMLAGAASCLSACFAVVIVAQATADQHQRRQHAREQVEL